jgi:hypothetical protein
MSKLFFACCTMAVLMAAHSPAGADPSDTRATPSRVRVGVIAGINITKSLGRECTVSCAFTEFDPEATLQTGEKLAGGVFLTYALDPRYRLRVEARFTVKGVKAVHLGGGTVFLDDGTSADAVLVYTLNHSMRYIQVPILAQRDFHYDGVIRPHILAGLALGYLVSAHAEGTGTLLDEFNRQLGEVEGEAEYGDAAKKLDVSAIAGVGISFPMPRGSIEFGMRYEISLLSALDGLFLTSLEGDPEFYQPGTTQPDPAALVDSAPLTAESMRHHMVTLTVGYQF